MPDLVHTHSGKAGILGRIAAKRAGVPLIIHHIHGPSFGPFQGPLANFVFTAAERYAARVTDHFFCSAGAMTRNYLAVGIGRPAVLDDLGHFFFDSWQRIDARPFDPEAPVRIDPGLRPGLVFMTMHFPDEVDTNRLTSDAVDPRSGTAEFKATAVRLEKR